MCIIGFEHKVTMWLCISIQRADFMDQINIYHNLKSEFTLEKINYIEKTIEKTKISRLSCY